MHTRWELIVVAITVLPLCLAWGILLHKKILP
jgi:hypothetical protein